MKAGRLIFLSLAVFSLIISPASAVTKSVAVTAMTLISALPSDISPIGMQVRGSVIYLYGGRTGNSNLDGFVRAMDSNGAILWSQILDSGGDEIITAATVDTAGHIWLVGTASPAEATPTSTQLSTPAGVLNPDSVVLDPSSPLRKDLTTLILWEVDPTGNIVSTKSVNLNRSFIARSLAVASTGTSIVGAVATTSGNAGFFISTDANGIFGKLAIIGNSETELNSITKLGDNYLISGSSAEKILGKPLIGIRDGILLSSSASGKIFSVVRSANGKSSRSWKGATPSFLIGGDAVTVGVSEAVVTKFSAKLLPAWSMRFPAIGPALVIDTPILRYAVFGSNSAIAGIKSWKPSKPATIALGLDSKGIPQTAFSAKSIALPLALGYSSQLGLVLLGQTGQNTVSLFHTLTR